MLKNFVFLLLITLFSAYVFKKEVIESADPTSVTLIESGLSWNGDSLPNYPVGKPKISILKITIPPHSELPLHFHPTINAGVLLSGELEVIDEHGNTLKMKTGDPLIEVVNTIHTGKNYGDIPAVIMVFYAGTDGVKITEKVK